MTDEQRQLRLNVWHALENAREELNAHVDSLRAMDLGENPKVGERLEAQLADLQSAVATWRSTILDRVREFESTLETV